MASVAAQTVLPVELILIDDGSGDETRALITQLQSRYNAGWIQLVLLDVNAGVASARNAGWDQAIGEFVAFLDSDDAWHPQKIELQYRFMSSATDVSISGHGRVQVNDSQEVGDAGKAKFQKVTPLHVFLKNPFAPSTFMVRRELGLRFLSGRRHMEDHYFLMQLSIMGFGIANARAPLVYIFKSIFGDAGLSADMLQMQRSELENYRLIGRAGNISYVTVVLLQTYSWLKFFRRYLIVRIRDSFSR